MSHFYRSGHVQQSLQEFKAREACEDCNSGYNQTTAVEKIRADRIRDTHLLPWIILTRALGGGNFA